ncbi:hypothetical protein DUI87_09502 [Hirundo rustica rustica]|uniref:Uncharacterized protein n=1 Tax=Hirundo rustica rustica TaxID=333673 RepID=A0A3M0KMU1_HIRRU|nr:hypothetical protein DUI87_09502 [Hirundo rustica rustica]
MTPHLEERVQLWGPQNKKGMEPTAADILAMELYVVEEGFEDALRAGAPLLRREAERAGIVQPGEGSGETLYHLPAPKGDVSESWRGTFDKDIKRA